MRKKASGSAEKKRSESPRYMYFPVVQIFGKRLVPVYYVEEEPVIPLSAAAGVVGLSPEQTAAIVSRHREIIRLLEGEKGKAVEGEVSAEAVERLCVGMEGICLLILAVDPEDLSDPAARQRLLTAKLWLVSQVVNRLKRRGQKNQPRWDAGLSRSQIALLKQRFAALPFPSE